jgi:hypothetical protein
LKTSQSRDGAHNAQALQIGVFKKACASDFRENFVFEYHLQLLSVEI